MTPFRTSALLVLTFTLAGCNGDATANGGRFLEGTPDHPEIGLVINSTGAALTMFQLGDPTERRQIAFGPSNLVTPTGVAVRGTWAAVPLGNAASTALVDLERERVERYFRFASGNATGVAFVDPSTFLVANLTHDYVGKATAQQASDEITATVSVAPAPTAIVVAGNRAYVVSGNLDENFLPIGNGIVTAIDPSTMTVIDDVETGGTNPSAAALGPDGKLYVVNTGDFTTQSSVTIITLDPFGVETTVPGFLAGSGAIRIDEDGLAYVSSGFAFGTGLAGEVGTVVWNTATRAFVRGPDNPVCARRTLTAGNPCRGAFDADRAQDGRLYQAFFGSASSGLPPYIFVYAPGTYALVDSISAGVDAATIDVVRFREP